MTFVRRLWRRLFWQTGPTIVCYPCGRVARAYGYRGGDFMSCVDCARVPFVNSRRWVVLLFLIVVACGDSCGDRVHLENIEACRKACSGVGVAKVTATRAIPDGVR